MTIDLSVVSCGLSVVGPADSETAADGRNAGFGDIGRSRRAMPCLPWKKSVRLDSTGDIGRFGVQERVDLTEESAFWRLDSAENTPLHA